MEKVQSAMKSSSAADKGTATKKSVMYLLDLVEKKPEKKAKAAQPLVNVGKVSLHNWVADMISMHSFVEAIREAQERFEFEEKWTRVEADSCSHRG